MKEEKPNPTEELLINGPRINSFTQSVPQVVFNLF
jgi:hypothetical protein